MDTWTIFLNQTQLSTTSPIHTLVLSCISPSIWHIALFVEGGQEEFLLIERTSSPGRIGQDQMLDQVRNIEADFFFLVFYTFRHFRLLDFGVEASQLLKPSMVQGQNHHHHG